MALNTRTRRIATIAPRGKGRDGRRFERTVLPPHARVLAELTFTRQGQKTVEVLITDLSPVGIGVIATSSSPYDLPPLRRRVEVTLPEGHVLEGVVADKFGLEGAEEGIHRVGIELRAAGTTFDEVKARPQKLVLDLREALYEVLPCYVDASLPLLAGVTRLEGAVTLVSLECASVNFPYLHPGLFLGLEIDFLALLPEGEFQLQGEVSDILPSRTGAGVDVLVTFDEKPKRFLHSFAQFYLRQKLVQARKALSDELTEAGFLSD